MKEFSKWEVYEVEQYFRLSPVKPHTELTAWLAASVPITPVETEQLRILCEKLNAHVYDWNEEELKINFIGRLLTLVDYDQPDYQAFFERQLTVKVDEQRLTGIVDCLLAKGKRIPERPVFCLHEYKPEKHSSNDPLGQTLIAMVAAQRLNGDEKPIYGAYVVGRFWYFLVYTPPVYGVSPAFDAAKEQDLYDVFKCLKYIKQVIERELRDK